MNLLSEAIKMSSVVASEPGNFEVSRFLRNVFRKDFFN